MHDVSDGAYNLINVTCSLLIRLIRGQKLAVLFGRTTTVVVTEGQVLVPSDPAVHILWKPTKLKTSYMKNKRVLSFQGKNLYPKAKGALSFFTLI